jgi:hypothetical protein
MFKTPARRQHRENRGAPYTARLHFTGTPLSQRSQVRSSSPDDTSFSENAFNRVPPLIAPSPKIRRILATHVESNYTIVAPIGLGKGRAFLDVASGDRGKLSSASQTVEAGAPADEGDPLGSGADSQSDASSSELVSHRSLIAVFN